MGKNAPVHRKDIQQWQDVSQVAWITDPHFNFVTPPVWSEFAAKVAASSADLLLLSGDISEADDFAWHLERLIGETGKPLAFVLGNHDFYRGGFATSREVARRSGENPGVVYLTDHPPIELGGGWCLIGDDCPADARSGNPWASPIEMSDFVLIDEFRGLDDRERIAAYNREGDLARRRVERNLALAARVAEKILVVLHTPPFREACWYQGRISDDHWAPYFVCQAVGECLEEFADQHPKVQVKVLCGHTHSPGTCQKSANLEVITGGAEYGQPEITDLLQLTDA